MTSKNTPIPPRGGGGKINPVGRGPHRKESKTILALIAALLLLLLVWGISAFAASLIKVKKIEIIAGPGSDGKYADSDGKYADAEIIDASGITPGMRMNKLDPEAAGGAILERLPYVSEVKVAKGLFGRVRILVIVDKAAYYTLIAGDYFFLSQDLRLLDISHEAPDFSSSGLIRISLPKLKRAFLGEHLSFYDTDTDYITEFMQALNSRAVFAGRVERIELAGRYDISFKYDKFTVKIGAFADIADKLNNVARMEKHEAVVGADAATLDVSDLNNMTIKPQ